jgi:SulP family sulfate permease
VLVAATVARHGIDGLLLATLLAGHSSWCAGFLRLGTYVKFIPYPVTVGFTAGIAVIIFASQIKDLLGLTLPGRNPAEIDREGARAGRGLAERSMSRPRCAVAAGTIAPHRSGFALRPHWPGMLVAVVRVARSRPCSACRSRPSARRFGGIPAACRPRPAADQPGDKVQAVLPTRPPSRCWAPSNRCCRPWSPTA